MKALWGSVAALAFGLAAAGAASLDPVLNDPILSWNGPVPPDCKNAGTTIEMDSCAGTVFKKNYLQMIALCLDVRVDHLIVEELRGLRSAGNAPVVIIQQAAEKRELSLLIQDLDFHQIR